MSTDLPALQKKTGIKQMRVSLFTPTHLESPKLCSALHNDPSVPLHIYQALREHRLSLHGCFLGGGFVFFYCYTLIKSQLHVQVTSFVAAN